MDETAIRLDELGRLYRLLRESYRYPSEDLLGAIVDRAATLLAPDTSDVLDRKIIGVVAMSGGEIAESQIAWVLTPHERVIDIRARIDRLLRSGRLVRRGLINLALGSTK